MPKSYTSNIELKYATGSNVEVEPPEYQTVTELSEGGVNCAMIVSPQILPTSSGSVAISGNTGSVNGSYILTKNGTTIGTYTQNQSFSIPSDSITANTTYVLTGPAGSGCSVTRNVTVASATSCSLTQLSGPDASGLVRIRAVASNAPGVYALSRSSGNVGTSMVLYTNLTPGQEFELDDTIPTSQSRRYTLVSQDGTTCNLTLDVTNSSAPPAGCPVGFGFGVNTPPPYYPSQTVNIGASGIPVGDTYTVNVSPASSGFPLALTAANPDQNVTFGSTGTYTLVYSNNAGTCTGNRQITISALQSCSISLNNVGPIYPGDTVFLTLATGQAGDYFLSTGLSGSGIASFFGEAANGTFPYSFTVPVSADPDTYTASWTGPGCSVTVNYTVVEEPVVTGCELTPPSGFLWASSYEPNDTISIRVRTGSTAGTYTLTSSPAGLASGSYGPSQDVIISFQAPVNSSASTVTVSLVGPAGCNASESFNIQALVPCSLSLTGSGSITDEETTTLNLFTGNDPADSYTFTVSPAGAGTITPSDSIISTPFIPIPSNGNYSRTFTPNQVTVSTPVTITVSSSGSSCTPNSVNITVNPPAANPITASFSAMDLPFTLPGNTPSGCPGVLTKTKTLTISGGSGSYTVAVTNVIDAIGNGAYPAPASRTVAVTNTGSGSEELYVTISSIDCAANSSEPCPTEAAYDVEVTITDTTDPSNTLVISTDFQFFWNECILL